MVDFKGLYNSSVGLQYVLGKKMTPIIVINDNLN